METAGWTMPCKKLLPVRLNPVSLFIDSELCCDMTFRGCFKSSSQFSFDCLTIASVFVSIMATADSSWPRRSLISYSCTICFCEVSFGVVVLEARGFISSTSSSSWFPPVSFGVYESEEVTTAGLSYCLTGSTTGLYMSELVTYCCSLGGCSDTSLLLVTSIGPSTFSTEISPANGFGTGGMCPMSALTSGLFGRWTSVCVFVV